MKLTREGLKSSEWKEKGYILPTFDYEKVLKNTKENPFWIGWATR